MIPKNIETDYLIVKQQLDSFNRNKVVLWNKENDALPLNLTLNTSILDDSFKLKFHSFINKLKQNDDDLYWYEKERWHMTILGLIPTTDSLNGNNQDNVISEIIKILKQNALTQLRFRVYGVSLNKKAAAVLCFPVNFDLANLRTKLRDRLGIHGVNYTKHLEIFDRICWINFVRYPTIPSNEFYSLLKENCFVDFGEVDFGLHLRRNASSTLSNNQVCESEIVHIF